jgi:hypothetical protein
MAEGRSAFLWNHTSSLLALTANVNRDPKRKAFTPGDFNPHDKSKREEQTISVEQLTREIMAIADGHRQMGTPRGSF